MTTFDNRDKAFENKFAHDEELKFKVHARATRLLGLWAAGLLDKTGAEADSYALQILEAGLEQPGDADLLSKVSKDLESITTAKEIKHKFDDLLEVARQQFMKG